MTAIDNSNFLDITFKAGEIIAIVGSLGIGLFTIGRSASRVEVSLINQAKDIHDMQMEIKKLADIIVMQAVQTTKIDTLSAQYTLLQRTVEDLRRGDGWIGSSSRRGVDGEYP